MVLQTGWDLAGWESTFVEASISATSIKIYAQTFSIEEITRNSLHRLDRTMLKELGNDDTTILKIQNKLRHIHKDD